MGGKVNTIKEKVYGKFFKEKGQESHHYIKLEEKTVDENGNIIEKDLNEKANRVQAVVESFAAALKFEGETPIILIGDLPPEVEAFASPENNTIAIDRKVLALADANKVLTLVGHELGHFNSYDAKTESTAKRVEDAIQGTKNKGKYTEKTEKEFQEKYAGRDISGSEAQKLINSISEESRENVAVSDSSNNVAGAPVIGRVNVGMTQYYVIDTKTGEGNEVNTFDIGAGVGSPSLGASTSMVILPHTNKSKDIAGHFRVLGGTVSILGGELLFDSNNNFMGLKYNIGISPEVMPIIEGHGSFDSSIIRNVKEIKVTNKMIEYAKEIETLATTKESAISNAIEIDILSRKLLWYIRKEKLNGGNNENIKIKK